MVNETKIRQTFIGLFIRRGDSSAIGKERDNREWRLRNGLQAIPSDPCFPEKMLIDVTRHCLWITFRFLWFFVVVNIVRSNTIQYHMRTPAVIPTFKFFTQHGQVIEPFNDRDSLEPFVFQSFDHSLCDRNWAMFFDSTFQSIVDSSCIRSFKWSHGHDLTGEMVNHNTDMDGPYPPVRYLCCVDRPDMIGVPGGNWSGLYFLFWNSHVPHIIDQMEPTVESGSGDA